MDEDVRRRGLEMCEDLSVNPSKFNVCWYGYHIYKFGWGIIVGIVLGVILSGVILYG